MIDQKAPLEDAPRSALTVRPVAAFVVAATYCLLFLVRPGAPWPAWARDLMRASSGAVYDALAAVLGAVGFDGPPLTLSRGAYLAILAGLIPAIAARVLMGASFEEIGCRRPNRIAWRLLGVGFVASAPFLVFMAHGPGMVEDYLPEMRRVGYAAFLSYYAVNMMTEHFLCHGVLLAAFRADWRWPASPAATVASDGPPWRRLLLWIGLSNVKQHPGHHAVAAWLQLRPGCGFAIVASAAIFALIHVGKDWREAVLSLPGGLALAYIAYRGDSWLTPFLLHALTAGTTLALMVLLQA